jgi:hypothetical protein
LSPILLDDAPALLAPLERCPVNRAAGDGRRLPPRRFPSVLALAFWGPARSSEDHPAIRDPILRLAAESADWGAPKIHGELQKLGFVVSERSVARYLRRIRRRGDCARRWLTFLQNHREVIAALDFFTVTTVTFRLLYCFFGIEHGRRRILHWNVTRHPTAEWVVQQLRQAFPEAGPYRYAIFVRDSIFNAEVVTFLKANTNERPSPLAKMESRKDGLEVAGARSSTTSLRSANHIFADCYAIT